MELVATYTSPDGTRRVLVERHREYGWYTFTEERFSDDPLELAWIPTGGRRSLPQCDTLEIAIREASGRIDWLAKVLTPEA